MLKRKTTVPSPRRGRSRARKPSGPVTVGAYEAKTRFSELIARAENGESFTVTKNGRPVARITPTTAVDHEQPRLAGERMLARLSAAPRVSEEEAQRNWEELKTQVESERGQRLERWLKS